jgi:hypothetical protein
MQAEGKRHAQRADANDKVAVDQPPCIGVVGKKWEDVGDDRRYRIANDDTESTHPEVSSSLEPTHPP